MRSLTLHKFRKFFWALAVIFKSCLCHRALESVVVPSNPPKSSTQRGSNIARRDFNLLNRILAAEPKRHVQQFLVR